MKSFYCWKVIPSFLTCFLLLPALSGFSLTVHAQTLVFTAIPDQDETRLRQRFGKVATYLSEQLNIPVNYIPVKSYTAAVTAFRNNQVQLAWFGGLSGVQARRLSLGARALAQGAEDKMFKTYFIANKGSGLTPASQLPDSIAGMRFTFGSKGSTSGRLMPEYFLRQQFDKSPDKLFSRVGFSGDHQKTIELVASGAYQLGAVNYAVWEKNVAESRVDTDKVFVIWVTPSYPDYQWTIRGDVDAQFGAGFSQRVQHALLSMRSPDLLASFPRSAFIPAQNSDYKPIEQVARSIGLME